jgi:hypothetical protein
MKKNFFIGLLLILILLQLGYTSSKSIRNPSLMHMHRREFIAAGIAQGMAASGYCRDHVADVFADQVLQYTDALMKALDQKEDNSND